jgi:hypothetical protein
MPALRLGKRYLCLGLLLTAGCWSTDWTKNLVRKPEHRPPPQPEEFVLPPVTASRFSAPPDYPQLAQKEKQQRERLDIPTMPTGGPAGSRFGTGPGMRGP